MKNIKKLKLVCSKKIVITTQVEGFHSFKDAPDEVAFLRDKHRHLFKVIAILPESADRSLEFFLVQRSLNDTCEIVFKNDYSCEEYAEEIAEALLCNFSLESCEVNVLEDSENGAIVTLSRRK